jgi:hypothetical protein
MLDVLLAPIGDALVLIENEPGEWGSCTLGSGLRDRFLPVGAY